MEIRYIFAHSQKYLLIFIVVTFIFPSVYISYLIFWSDVMIFEFGESIFQQMISFVGLLVVFIINPMIGIKFIHRPFLRELKIDGNRNVSIRFKYLWGSLCWSGSAEKVRRAVVRSFAGSEGEELNYLHVKLVDNTWFCLGPCDSDLAPANKIHEALGLGEKPLRERGSNKDEMDSWFKARKVMHLP